MSRRKITLRLNSDVVERAKNAGMNLSYFLEVKLVEYLAILNVTPRRRFELLLPSRRTGFQGRRVRPDFATSAYGYN
jgi:post-segregation antitoxin CcdA